MPAARAQVPPATVPDVTGRPLETALAMIERAGLARGRIDERPSSGRPGIVLDQSLKPGTRVQRGTALHLAVAQEAEASAIVPDVTNRPLETALAMIERAGLARGRINERPSPGRSGIVLDQSLKPGTRVQRGTALHLAVAQEAEAPAIVPNVTNRPLETALAMIDKAGLARGRVVDRPSSGQPGIVLDQSLKPGTRVPRDTPLDLGVAQVELVTVPNVLNGPLEAAFARIDEAGLARGKVGSRESLGPPDLVLEQSPRPGARVPRGTVLNLTVSQVQLVTVPDVTKLPAGDAFSRIENAGLTRGTVTNREAPGPPEIVLEQSLRPGARVRRGTPLNLTLSQVQLVIVPDVMKLPVGDAFARIESAGLTRGNVTNREAPGPADLVLEQSPRPGARVPRGTLLNLTVSQVQLVTVPDLTHLPVGNALTRIDEIGLARGTVTNREAPGPADLILEQSLSPGARVPRGTALDLTVSQAQPATPPGVINPPVAGPPAQPSTPVALLVPDVVGHSVEEAMALVGRAGLTVGTVTERSFLLPPYFQPAGTVFQQQPAARTPLAAAVPVDLIVLPRVPAWAIIIPSAMLGAAIVLLLRRRLSSPLKAPPPQVPLPTVVTRAYSDAGDQRIPSVMNPVSPEIRVRHTADPGTQSIREMLFPSPH